MRALVTTLLAGTIVLVAAASSPPAATPLARSAPAPLPQVTVIGDSVATAILYDPGAQAILGRGIDLHLELAPCRRVAQESCPYEGVRPPNVLQLVETLGRRLGPTVIVSVGYNDYESLYARNLEEALDALRRAGVEHVIWATLRATQTGYLTMNDAIRAAAVRHPELTIADWNLYSRSHPEWFWPDGPHLKGEGARAMATLFHKTLVAIGIPASPRLEIVTGTLPAAVVGKAYATALVARGGRAPYRWSRGTAFPTWLRISTAGRLTGTVRAGPGRVVVAVRVTDAAGATTSRRLTLRIRATSSVAP